MSDLAKKQTIEISEKAMRYLTSSEDGLAHDIKSSLDALEIELDRFPLFSMNSPLMYQFVRFADAASGGDFESIARPIRTRSDKEVLNVLRNRNALLREIEKQFKAHYC